MKYVILNCLLLLLISCPPLSDVAESYYDPQKAGAEIVASYDLSSILDYGENIDNNIHISEFNNKFYFIYNRTIYVIDKYNIQKEVEISINENIYYPNINQDYYGTYQNIDLAVFKNKILFSYYFL
ncbi:MAG TPA: hypothetical protein DC057_03920, partial [Spirochaetia bacterium]|nr:hypothetical protein [Spirochaetia bacterium]